MAKVELSYNPYLLETKVSFNGKEPRINSLIEKYKNGSLYNWIEEMPSILHDEMNGYDFDLDFTGTDKDCDAIKSVFADVLNVEIFHKSHLDGRLEKNSAIDDLLSWLENNENRQFDYKQFREDNAELFDSAYPFIILNGGKVDEKMFAGLNVSADNIENLNTVEDSDLTTVPILVCVDSDSVKKLEENIRVLLSRNDVEQRQIFFMIHPSLNARRVERNLKDLGIKDLKTIESGDISQITDYMELFPMTEYIRDVIEIFNNNCQFLNRTLECKLKDNEVTGQSTRAEIETLSTGIEALKQAYENISNRSNINVPQKCKEAEERLKYEIKNWRKRKTKITKDDEAERYAKEFKLDLAQYFRSYIYMIDAIFNLQKDILEKNYLDVFMQAGFDRDYVPDIDFNFEVKERIKLPEVADYTKLKHEIFVEQRDLFDNFFSSTPSLDLVREVTYYNQEWRDYAEEKIIPKAEYYRNKKCDLLIEYDTLFATDLMKHIEDLLEQEIEKKKLVVSQMSSTERELQADADWLGKVNEMVEGIMRG